RACRRRGASVPRQRIQDRADAARRRARARNRHRVRRIAMPLDTGLSITPGRVVGQPIDRRDGRLKVTGRARYAAEFDIDNLAHAVLVQSTIASGEIIGFNLADAQAVPGVLTIMTPDNAPRLPQAGCARLRLSPEEFPQWRAAPRQPPR